MDRIALGDAGQEQVAALLRERGFLIVAEKVRAGRYEIDLVASRGRMLVFCEVRTRSSDAFGRPAETVGPKKIASLRAGAARWLQENPTYRKFTLRFDVAGVLWRPGREPEIDYYVDAF